MHNALKCLFILLACTIFCGCGGKPLSIRYPSSIYLDAKSKSYPVEAEFLRSELFGRLSEDESSDQYSKPGFEFVVGSEDGDYLLNVEIGDRTDVLVSAENKILQTVVNASLWLRKYGDTKVWSQDFACRGTTLKDAIRQCAQLISHELKSAQVKKGKPAGKLGWEKGNNR